jgi:hypothetical protein
MNRFYVLLPLCLAVFPAAAGTLELRATAIDRVAVLSRDQPETAVPVQGGNVTLKKGTVMLVRFSLEALPEGQRIARAELSVPVTGFGETTPRFFLWRVLSEWGARATARFRMTEPEQQTWSREGAEGRGTDRGLRPTAVERLRRTETVKVNVTEDVEIWHENAAPNWGWLVTVEDPGATVNIAVPGDRTAWKMRITYEP